MNINERIKEAQVLMESGEFSKASRIYQDIIQNDASNPRTHIDLAKCLYALKENNRAIEAGKRALDLDPKLADPHIIFASVYWRKKEYDKSETEFKIAIEKDPNSAFKHTELGRLFFSLERFDEAISSFKQALDIDPVNQPARLNLAFAYINKRKYLEGEQELKKIYATKKNFVVWFSLIQVYFKKNKLWIGPITLILFLISFLFPTIYIMPIFMFFPLYFLGMATKYALLKRIVIGIIIAVFGLFMLTFYMITFFN